MPESVTVRPMAAGDLPLVLGWRNHPDIRAHMYTRHEIGPQEHADWFARASQDGGRRLLIVEQGGQPLGFVQLSRVSAGGVADWGFYASPEAPRGSGRKLGRAALDHAFEVDGVHKVCGEALASNERSIRLHQALGFRQEGVLREQHRIGDNHYVAVLRFGLLALEWQALRTGEDPWTCPT